MNSASYIKIALFFVILGGAGAGYVVLSANGISTLNTQPYEVILPDATGLSTRSKIYLAGVPVGKVQAIRLNGSEARLRLAVFRDVEIRGDALISRRASSLLGTSVLNLDPGTEFSPVIPPGSVIRNAPTHGDMSAAMGMVQDLGGQLGVILDEFRINHMALLSVSLETFNSITRKIDAQSESQLDNISRILESAALISERTEGILRNSDGDIRGSVTDIHEALANIRSITGEIATGRGNLGQTIYDDRLYDSILATAEKAEAAAGKLGDAIENISALAKNADGVVTSAGEIVNKALGLGVQVEAGARYDFLAKTARGGASLRIEPASGDRWYRVGVSSNPDGIASRTLKEITDSAGNTSTEDTTETKYRVSVDAELARRFGILTLRGGLLESTGGFGVDVQPLNWLCLSGELFHFRTGEYPNLRGAITFYPFFNPDSNKPWNWIYLRGGINNALSGSRDYFIGGGVRFADREVKGLVGLVPVFNN